MHSTGTKGLPISHNPEAQKATPSVCVRGEGGKKKYSYSLWLGWLMRVLQVNLQGTNWHVCIANMKQIHLLFQVENVKKIIMRKKSNVWRIFIIILIITHRSSRSDCALLHGHINLSESQYNKLGFSF